MRGSGIVPMTENLSGQIAAWEYPEEYSVYNICGPLDDSFYAMLNISGRLIGFYQFGPGARIPTAEEDPYSEGPLDIGLGLRPDLCGLGLGRAFVQFGIEFARETKGADVFRLTVAGFNLRARKVYERCGFVPVGTVTHGKSGEPFTIMLL